MVHEIHHAIEKNDARGLRHAAHTLKGEVGNFGAAAAFDAALQLETIGRDKKLTRAAAAYTVLIEA
jgi:HPt (histidine-containing phosphotransfer) domain-containing protein